MEYAKGKEKQKREKELKLYLTLSLTNCLSTRDIIPIKLKNINSKNFNDKLNEYNNYVNANSFVDLMCPCCKAIGNFKPNTTYDRNLIYIENESFDEFNNQTKTKIVETKITITVIRCESCHKHHALLPTFILPYHIYSAYFIMLALAKKIICNDNLHRILLLLNISPNLFYYWERVFKKYIPAASIIINANADPPNILTNLINDFNNFLSDFYNHFFLIFFLNTDNHLFW